MINANELRIGNWVRYHHDGGFIDAPIFHLTDEDVRVLPIPLTPEILEKAGFTMSDTIWDEDYLSFRANETQPNEIEIKYIDNVIILGTGDSYYDVELTHIKHLHQLQNLIFALTGQELEINI